MLRENLNDLLAFVAIARAGSFTRAAAQLGVSQSTLSHGIKALETRIGVRLLVRTTRQVVPTPDGEEFLRRIAPQLEQIEDDLREIVEAGSEPTGSFRITATDYAAETVLWPKLMPLLREHPGICVEIVADYGLTDIVGGKFDAGVRLGEQVAEGMIAVKIGPDARMIAVAAPEYLATNGTPVVPQDLAQHRCINIRLPTHGSLYAWEFEKDGREVRVRVEGQVTFNYVGPCVTAATEGFGIAFVPDALVANEIADGRLRVVLDDWTPPFPGYFLYYPHRRQSSRAFSLIVECLRYRD